MTDFVIDPRERWRLAQAAKASQRAVESGGAVPYEPTAEDYAAFGTAQGLPSVTELPSGEGGVLARTAPNEEPADATMLEQDALQRSLTPVNREAQAINTERAQAQARAEAGVPGRAAENGQRGAALFNNALQASQKTETVRAPRPGYATNKKANAKLVPLIANEEPAQAAVNAAQLSTAQTQTDLLARAADEQLRLHEEMIGRAQAQAAREEAVRQKVLQAHEAVQQSVAEAAKASDIDPDRAWGEKGTGAKILAVIASGLLGWAGLDPFAHINAVIQNSIDAQKYNRDQKRAQVGVAQAQAGSALNAYEQIRAQIGDEKVSDEVYRLRSLQVIEAQALAKLSEAGVQELTAKQDQFMNGLRQQIVEQERRVGLAIDANTPYITTVRPVLRGSAARLNEASGNTGLRMMERGAEQGVTEAGLATRQGVDVRAAQDLEQTKAANRAAATGPVSDTDKRLLFQLQKETAIDQGIVDKINKLEAKWGDDIPGFGTVGWLGTAKLSTAQRDTYYDIVNTITRSLRPETGAAYTAQEIENATMGIVDEKMPTEDANALRQAVGMLRGANEDNVRHILTERKELHRARIRHFQAPFSKEALQSAGYDTNVDLTPRPIENFGEEFDFQPSE